MTDVSILQAIGFGIFVFLLLGLGLYLYGRAYYPEDLQSCNPEYEGSKLSRRAVVVVYYLKNRTLSDYIDGLSVDFDNGTWAFGDRILILGQGACFDLPTFGRVGIAVLDDDNPLVGYGHEEGSLFELAGELASEAANKGCRTPIGRLSVYHSV